MSIALNMIVGPYYEPFFIAAVESAIPLCDELVFVDTAPGNCPNRKQMEVYQVKYGAKIIDMPRGEDKDFDFALARELARVNTDRSEWILRLDADEVLHEDTIYPLKLTLERAQAEGYNAIEVGFYHHMVYPWLFQYVEPKIILFRKDKSFWSKEVHESLHVAGNILRKPQIRFHHYGYCRGQEEVFKRWQLYVEIDGRPTWYQNTNPSTILEDRIPVCMNFEGTHPDVVIDTLDNMFGMMPPFRVREIPRYSMSDNHVGLLLITYNDEENLGKMLSSFEQTIDYPVHVHVIDMGSTDGTRRILTRWDRGFLEFPSDHVKSITLSAFDKLESLSVTQNYGFKQLMSRQECEYIGWIHPDMVFEKPWLKELVATLQVHPEIGKICSFNTRDGLPPFGDDVYEGHEQAYIIRRGVLYRVGLFDENFIGIGGYEDWDMNNRIRREGWKVAITTKSQVNHKAMATRERRDTTYEQVHNAGVYQRKWNTGKEWIDFDN